MDRLYTSGWALLVVAALAPRPAPASASPHAAPAVVAPLPAPPTSVRRSTPAQAPDSLVRSVAPDGAVSISAREADVTVVGSTGGSVVVRARPETLRRIRLEGSDRRVIVRDQGAKEPIEVAVPGAVEVDVHTRAGDVTLRGLTGRVQVESMSGDVHVQGDPRSLRVQGVSGDVTVSGTPARLEASTVSGDVTAPSATGSVDVSTASGSIEVGGRAITDGTFSSASGDITFRARPASSASLGFETASGDITLGIPDDVGVSYEVTTVSGELRTDRPAQLQGSQHFGGGRHYRLSVGDGSVHVTVQAVSGDVHIEGS